MIIQVIKRNQAKEKGLTKYFTGNPCIRGHTSDRWTACASCVECKSGYASKKYKEDKINIRELQNIYRKNNRAKCLLQSVTHRANYKASGNKEKARLAWNKANPLNNFFRMSITRMERSVTKETIKKAEEEMGYTQKEFYEFISSKFCAGMSWSNRRKWHIDHIKPIIVFEREGVTDPSLVNALSNLQPLWATDNRIKGAKY